jgi:hypothetical protein
MKNVLIGGLLGALLIVGVVNVCKFIDAHTVTYNCHQADEGWVCDTKWK